MIAIVDYGLGNLRSVQKACEAANAQAIITGDAALIERADGVILPGVGAFRDAIAALKETKLDRVVQAYAAQGKPLLGICLGHQLLFEKSYEDGEHDGLGLIAGAVRKIDDLFEYDNALKVPHMGWNSLVSNDDPVFDGLRDGDKLYFVHSYAADCPSKYVIAATEYGGKIVAAVRHNNVYGMQFHPEKSGDTGLLIVANFVRMTKNKD